MDTVEIVFRGYYLKRWLFEEIFFVDYELGNVIWIEVNNKRCSYIHNAIDTFSMEKLPSSLFRIIICQIKLCLLK